MTRTSSSRALPRVFILALGALLSGAPPASVGSSAAAPARERPTINFSALVRKLKLKEKAMVIKETSDVTPTKELAAKLKKRPYTVVLINRSARYTVVAYRIDKRPWVFIAPVGRTCDLATCDDCHKAGAGVPLTTVPCDSDPFDLSLIVVDSDGKQTVVKAPEKVQPSCDFDGEPICLDI